MTTTKHRAKKSVKSRPTDDASRSAVMAAVATQVRAFPDLLLDELDDTGLNTLDAAFAHALYDTVIRRWMTVRFLVAQHLDVPFLKLEPHVASAVMCGAAQIVLMDKVPAHAAVNAAVNWARLNASHRSGGLVNAVLRRVSEMLHENEERRARASDRLDELPLSDGTAVALRAPILPEDATERLSITTSHPRSLIEFWAKSFSLDRAIAIALHSLARPPVILNTSCATGPLPADASPHTLTGHHVFVGTPDRLTALLASRQDIWVQDPASSLAVESVVDFEPGLVIDACAGRGTKTRQLERTFPGAKIIASDTDPGRHATLERVFEGSERVTVIPHHELLAHAGTADLVLLDVPCSNTGVLARRVEAKYRVSKKRTDELVGIQRQIVADAIPLLREGRGESGGILYSTCSLDIRENEQIASWATKWHRFGAARQHVRPPEGAPGGSPERYSDGSFAVLLS